MEIVEHYREWEIRWTGFKSRKSIFRGSINGPEPQLCAVCKLEINRGDEVQQFQNNDEVKHWVCAGITDDIVGQMLGWFKLNGQGWKYIYANASVSSNGAPYHRGDIFYLPELLGHNSSEEEREQAKSGAILRLKKLIDDEETNPSGFWGDPPAAA